MDYIDEQRIKRILERPSAVPTENVLWLIGVITQLQEELAQLCGDDFIPHESGDECISCERPASEDAFPYCALCLVRHQRDYANDEIERQHRRFVQLQVDYAEEKIHCFKAEQDLDECREKLAKAKHSAVAWSRRVLPG